MKNISENFIDDDTIDNNFLNFSELLDGLKRRKKVLILTSTFIFSLTIINLTYKRLVNPVFQGSFTIMIKNPILDKQRNSSDSGYIENLAINNSYSDIPTLIQYLTSEKVILRTANLNNISLNSLKNKIKITVPKNPDVLTFLPSILKVNVISSDKIKLNNIIQNLSKDYIRIASDTKKEKIKEGINFLNKEKPSLEKRANELQDYLETFRLSNKLIDPIKEAEAIRSRIEKIRSNILFLESENIRFLFIKDNLLNGILFTEGINNGTDKSGLEVIGAKQLLLQEILDLKAALAKAQSTYKKESKVVLNLEAKLNNLEPILLENQKSAVDAAITVNNGKIKSLKNELSELEKEFAFLPKLINKYSKIMSDQKLVEANLTSLLSARENLKLELSQGTLPWKIISRPYINPRPFKPEINSHLAYGIMLSLFLGILLSIIIDKIDDVFHRPEDIEKEKKIPPLLGFIPFLKLNKFNEKSDETFLTINNLVKLNEENKSFNFIFEETFRNIYTAIKFSTSDKGLKSIAITSTIPSEGKSLFSSLLGFNVSEINKKVLVIDVDLRRPSLHKKLEVDNVLGLSNFLVNEKYNWKDAVNQYKDSKNLFYITGGKAPPNPIKLLDSERMRKIIKDIRDSNEFDLIILDCPPILGLSDTLIISEMVDGLILTISLNKVTRQLVKESLQKLGTTTSEILGVVANTLKEVDNNLKSSNKYYYQYKYGYQNKYIPLETENAYAKIETSTKTNGDEYESNDLIKKTLSKFMEFKTKFLNWINE